MRVELCCCESVLLSEIAMKEMNQKQIAQTYRMALESGERDRIDWAKVNNAIISRWSKSGLKRIKELAWSGKAFNK